MDIVESAPPRHGRFTALDSSNRSELASVVGPSDPLEYFPVALLPKAIDAAEAEFQTERLDTSSTAEERAIAVIAAILDVNRNYWGTTHNHDVSLVRIGGDSVGVTGPNGLLVDLKLSENLKLTGESTTPSYFIGRPEEHPAFETSSGVTPYHSNFADSLRALTIGAVDRKLIHGNPGLIFPEHTEGERRILRDVAMSVLEVVRNSPFNPNLTHQSEAKPRFKFIRAINAGDSSEAMGFVENTISRRPQLIEMPGWCEGITFHKASQLGQIELLRKLVQLGKSEEVHETTGKTIEELLAVQDADGSTPAQLAHRYGNDECLDLLLSEGGALSLPNRFGFIPRITDT